uniref:Uncharacterized protein n=1 Tax=Ixodes ricinus TaxID=34613 RepID=A0A147BDV8_IXORI
MLKLWMLMGVLLLLKILLVVSVVMLRLLLGNSKRLRLRVGRLRVDYHLLLPRAGRSPVCLRADPRLGLSSRWKHVCVDSHRSRGGRLGGNRAGRSDLLGLGCLLQLLLLLLLGLLLHDRGGLGDGCGHG